MMKKLVYFSLMAAIAVLFMVSCSSTDTPSGAMKSYLSAVKSGDYEKFVEGINFSKVKPEKLAETREGFTAMMKEKAAEELDKKGGLKDFEILSEEIAEDGNSAVVKYKQIYGTGEEEEGAQKLVKVDGKWLMNVGK